MQNHLKIAFVTGISGGIGNAIAHQLLQNGFFVFGIGRSNTIREENYQFISLDLRKPELVNHFNFPQVQATSYLLVNNAGIIGDILPVGELNAAHFSDVMQVNTVAPQVLINTFIQTFSRQLVPLHILNISSGAGKKPIDAWSAYCSSKAALDMFGEAIKLEMTLRERSDFHIHNVAPGVVDTSMQKKIRAASPEKFKASQRFHDLKNNNELVSAEQVAEKLMQLIYNPGKYETCTLSLSDI
ncbi:MAG: SDR family NAD(P)-dependent oxidoreductase [Bacteroidetes bacterium]|nr:SDR family NAD(P)-dependent oxidoreductase [Bacteroidota bacterium]